MYKYHQLFARDPENCIVNPETLVWDSKEWTFYKWISDIELHTLASKPLASSVQSWHLVPEWLLCHSTSQFNFKYPYSRWMPLEHVLFVALLTMSPLWKKKSHKLFSLSHYYEHSLTCGNSEPKLLSSLSRSLSSVFWMLHTQRSHIIGLTFWCIAKMYPNDF